MDMAKIILTCGFLLSLLMIASPAYAYLDPGTGSVLLQSIFAGVASVFAVLRIYWQRVKKYFWMIWEKIKINFLAHKNHLSEKKSSE